MKMIDSDKLLRDLRGICDVLECQGDPFLAAIVMRCIQCTENQKEVIVHCKDCKHYHAEIAWCDIHSNFVLNGEPCQPSESREWKMFDDDYFCADGIQREEPQESE